MVVSRVTVLSGAELGCVGGVGVVGGVGAGLGSGLGCGVGFGFCTRVPFRLVLVLEVRTFFATDTSYGFGVPVGLPGSGAGSDFQMFGR